MKKFMCFMLGIVFIISMIPAIAISAVSEVKIYNDFEYVVVNDSTIRIRAYYGNDSELTVPSEIEGKTVTEIDNFALSHSDTLIKLIIPDSVRYIGEKAFASDTSLTDIKLPDNMEGIGLYLFMNCTSLTSIRIPDGVSVIDGSTFYNCKSLNSLYIPDSVIGMHDTFFKCYSLKDIEVSDNNPNYKDIDGILFSKDGTLLIKYPALKTDTIYKIPEDVEYIDGDAFEYCSSLCKIIITKNVSRISTGFAACTSLNEIDVVEGNTSFKEVDDVLFSKDGKNLVSYPAGKTGDSYIVPFGVETIGIYSFCNCTFLKSLTIPKSVVTFGYDNRGYVITNVYTDSPDSIDKDFIIRGYADSAAYAFANRMGFKFEPLLIYGDLNEDSSVNLKDSLLLKKYIANMDVVINEQNADMNVDGYINSKDSLLLRQYNAHLIIKL